MVCPVPALWVSPTQAAPPPWTGGAAGVCVVGLPGDLKGAALGIRDLYDVEAKEPVRRMSDKTDSRKPATGEQAFLRGHVQNIYQAVRHEHQ